MTNDTRHTQLHAIYHYLIVVVASLVLCLTIQSCHEETIYDDSCQISFDTSVQDNVNFTRATIFENQNDILNDDENGKGGGKLTMHAYVSNTGTERFRSRAWYFNNVWRFYDASSNKFYNHYWPNYSMDFFAYMPWDGSEKQKMITVGEHTSSTDQSPGLNITCNIPEPENLEDTKGQETIIAYTPNKHKETVYLHFVHPFAAVSFELKQAHRN